MKREFQTFRPFAFLAAGFIVLTRMSRCLSSRSYLFLHCIKSSCQALRHILTGIMCPEVHENRSGAS